MKHLLLLQGTLGLSPSEASPHCSKPLGDPRLMATWGPCTSVLVVTWNHCHLLRSQGGDWAELDEVTYML